MTYTIKDVAKITGLSIFTIRFYDKEGLLPFVSRNKSGIREFTESDINQIKTICCLKNTGMQIKDIKKYIDFCMEGASTIDSRKKLFLEHRNKIINQINALTENLKLIDLKLEIYTSPNAVEIINEQIRIVNDEKRENCLPSRYTQITPSPSL
ncbi:MerR family transcriptional regulator [Lacrimispora amygdalina]|uniref:MerR family transcriptional regulator n=1 Tax=Lacrimispora amygdalina TaxID=253257 RepID=A0A3E2N3X1_9FIRM|nr:MerR family transcriptional regulator [Clostridium indicum]RFZ75700.1 MerR family transcriptional regulator [Clostridium indicum]